MPMEDLLTRQAPHSQEAEQSVLGSMLIDSRCISDVVGVVRPEDFYLQANREIYETMYEMFSYSEVIDPVTVLDKMRARGVYNEESSTKYLMQLMEITPTSAIARNVFAPAIFFMVTFSTSGSCICVTIRKNPINTDRMHGCVATFLKSVFLSGASVK